MALEHVTSDLPEQVESLATEVIDAGFRVHRKLGPGMLESIYVEAMGFELDRRGLRWRKEVPVSVIYDGNRLARHLRLDLLVEDSIVLEIKSVEKVLAVHKAQLSSYVRAADKPLGFLFNFNTRLFKEGIYRRIR